MNNIGKFFGWIIFGLVVLFFAVLFGVCDLVGGDDNDHDGMGRIQLVSHEYECMSHECGGDYGGDYGGDDGGGYDDGYGRGDRSDSRYEEGGYYGGGGADGNHGGRYEGGRGGSDYDGDGDGNRCRNFCFYGIPEPDPGGPQQASLFPPTPGGVRDFVVNVTKSGIEMGRLFAETTITFVENLLVGLA